MPVKHTEVLTSTEQVRRRKEVRLILRFPDERSLADWAADARTEGLLPENAGIRAKDALDAGGRPADGDFILASDPGPGDWLVEHPGR